MGGRKKQNTRRNTARRNRYYSGAKLSEHKFLRILHGFAQGLPVSALEPTTHISAKTIRASYRRLRATLVVAAEHHPDGFGGAGHVLAGREAHHLLHTVRRSGHYRRYAKRHAPRLSCPNEEQLLVTEATVRLICALDLRAFSLHDDEAGRDEAILLLANGVTRLHPRDPPQRLAEFVPNVRAHAHPGLRLYQDYRRYLLKNPLGGATR